MTINKPSCNNSCHSSKCVICNLRFVCASSPYCRINNPDNEEAELSKLYQKIEELENIIAGFVNSQVSVVSGILEEFKNINDSMGNINKPVLEQLGATEEEIKSLKEIISNTDVNQNIQSEIVPAVKDQNVLVEKKGLFGKSKWVEDKK